MKALQSKLDISLQAQKYLNSEEFFDFHFVDF
jgi:hypothetical protein